MEGERPRPRRPGRPPAVGRILLAWLLPAEVRQEIVGDLEERFAARLSESGRFRATAWYWGQVLRSRPLGLRRAARGGAGGPGRGREGLAAGRSSAGWLKDVQHAARALVGRPGFSLTVVTTVALAIGATTSVFSVVNGVLLRPLDYPEPERLVRAWQTHPEWIDHANPQFRAFGIRFPLSVPTFTDWADARTGLESMGIEGGETWVLRTESGAEVLRGLQLTSGVLRALGVPAFLGRTLLPEDDEVGAQAVALLPYRTWRDRFGGDRDIVGRSISLDGVPHVVVGVMPRGFEVPGSEAELWTPLGEEEKVDERSSQSYTVIGRLRPGATVEGAQADLEAVQARLGEIYRDEQGDNGAHVEGLLESLVGSVRSTLLFLLAAVGLVLLIACVNIANMLSVMGLVRRRELSVRAALGASRFRLVRGLLTESALLAILGGGGGIAISLLTLPLMRRALPSGLPRGDGIGMDVRVLAFGLLAIGLTALIAGVLPALQVAGTHPKQVMDSTGRGLAGGRSGERARAALVVTEIALSFVLLVGATLLGTSFVRLWNVDRGFSTEGLIVMSVYPDPIEFPEAADRARFQTELRGRLEAIPGTRVSVANQIPLSGSSSSTSYAVDRPDGTLDTVTTMISVVGEDYFDVAEIPILEGRPFEPADFVEGPLVGIVNEEFAERYWPGESAVGKDVRDEPEDPPTTIVGVSRNVRHQGLDEPAQPKLYVTTGQSRRQANNWLIRAQGDPGSVMDLAREAVAEVSRATPVRSLDVLDETIARSVAVQRFRTYLVVGLAGMATVLALLGVYGVLSFAVSQKTRELAVRMAIGAHPRVVVASTIASGVRLAVIGTGVGLLLALKGTGVVREFLFEIDPMRPTVYLAVAAIVGGVSALAAYLPARRAARVDPASVLNAE